MQYFTIIVAALIGLFSIRYTNTDRIGKRAKVMLMILLVICSSYSIYQTHRDEAFLEPWQATRLVYDRVIKLKSHFDTTVVSDDTAAMKRFIDEANEIALYAEEQKAPQSVRMKIYMFVITEQVLMLSVLHPKYSLADILNESMQSQSPGISVREALLKMSYFRVEDFGPPYYVLSGIDSRGIPIVVENRLNKKFFESRAQDLLKDLMLATE